jgi:hypothetical protein
LVVGIHVSTIFLRGHDALRLETSLPDGMAGRLRLSLHQRLNSSLPNWLPWSEWMITDPLGRLRHTAIVSASSTKPVCMREPMLQPTTARECKSNTLYTLLCVVACERVQSEFKSHKRKDSLRLMSYKF